MEKYRMSRDDVLNVRAIYGGTVTIAADEHLERVHRIERPETPWPQPTRCNVHFKSVGDSDYTRARTLFLKQTAEELQAILSSIDIPGHPVVTPRQPLSLIHFKKSR